MDPAIQTDSFSADRKNMVESQLWARGIVDKRVLNAMARVPRHEFVAESYWKQAYEDHPVPIGEGQTVSQPYIVGLMLQVLALSSSDKVLEIGAGSGYMTALLAELSGEVYSIERYPALAREAEARLARLGYRNAKLLAGDGSEGLPDLAPFDAIIVSAAAPYLPAALFSQLREGGRMVIPVGPPDLQELRLIRNQGGTAVSQRLAGCRFLPLIGRQGYSPA